MAMSTMRKGFNRRLLWNWLRICDCIMIVDDSKCLCEKCLRQGYCALQKRIGKVQEILYFIPPNTTTVKVVVEKCRGFVKK
jgi:hypothetical protein